jgi:8-amino-7-oxononanoate synthase
LVHKYLVVREQKKGSDPFLLVTDAVMKNLSAALQVRRDSSLYRTRQVLEGPQGVSVRLDGREYLSFCSNDYLGLANHPDVVAAFHQGLDRFGAGSGAAHLITGHSRAHHELEEALADFVQRPRALLFSTGYMANLGVLAALAGRGNQVFEDRGNHASLLDGARLSGARLVRYRHADAGDLARRLESASCADSVVASDGVFSMDGDIAPLPALARTAAAHAAWLLVDDAHGLGVVGPQGRGSLAAYGLGMDQVPILMGTLGKAFGTFGAFVAGSDELVETLIQEARTWIYTTAPPPAVAVATLAALRLAGSEDWRRAHLQLLVRRFRAGATQIGLNLCDSATPIQPVIAGSAEAALRWSAALREAGILITAIRPPTVPEGTARLRITFSAIHSESQVDRLLDTLEQTLTAGNTAGAF